MKICVLGMGYVGLVTAACFAERGHDVLCADSDAAKIESLSRGVVPIMEPGLDEMIERNSAAGRLRFYVGTPSEARDARVFFITVGTPPRPDYGADLSQVSDALHDIASVASDGAMVVVKSTVPPGTSGLMRVKLDAALRERGERIELELLSNPEFLREGTAVRDCMEPERIVIGARSAEAERVMRELYENFAPADRVLVMTPESAEIAKYAANTMLAARISMMNEIAGLCDAAGADVEDVRAAIALDPRIGPYFLASGCGYGGSCFPKDVLALVRSGEQRGLDMTLATAVDKVNRLQKGRLAMMVRDRFGDLRGARAAVLGLAFKPDTDDMRSAPSVDLIHALVGMGAAITAYDPAAMTKARGILPDEVRYAASAADALRGADFAVITTEWREFSSLDWSAIGETMARRVIFDGRNIFSPSEMERKGFEYYCIGRGHTPERAMRSPGQRPRR